MREAINEGSPDRFAWGETSPEGLAIDWLNRWIITLSYAD